MPMPEIVCLLLCVVSVCVGVNLFACVCVEKKENLYASHLSLLIALNVSGIRAIHLVFIRCVFPGESS